MNIWASLYRYSFNKYVVKQFRELQSVTADILQGDRPVNISFGQNIKYIKSLKAKHKYSYGLTIFAEYMDFHNPSIAELHERADVVFSMLSNEERERIVLKKITVTNKTYSFDYLIRY